LLENKIKKVPALKKIIVRLRKNGKKIVFTNGCFDILHYGHVKYLQDAKREGDILVVAINSDASARSIKGKKRPVVAENDRLRIIAALASVDYVVLFNADTPLEIIKQIKPDILIKGADWKKNNIVGADFVARQGGQVFTIPLVNNRSTTNLIKKIAQAF
jgi:D-beta-D-heptose 7-phosphate kinase/D-beta-D-heptose 1-phosphate adenosyltransferase